MKIKLWPYFLCLSVFCIGTYVFASSDETVFFRAICGLGFLCFWIMAILFAPKDDDE